MQTWPLTGFSVTHKIDLNAMRKGWDRYGAIEWDEDGDLIPNPFNQGSSTRSEITRALHWELRVYFANLVGNPNNGHIDRPGWIIS